MSRNLDLEVENVERQGDILFWNMLRGDGLCKINDMFTSMNL